MFTTIRCLENASVKYFNILSHPADAGEAMREGEFLITLRWEYRMVPQPLKQCGNSSESRK